MGEKVCSHALGSQAVARFGAIDFVTKELTFLSNTTHNTSETVCQLLRVFHAQPPELPITVVLDNVRHQRCRLVQDVALELDIELMCLPWYSANLNLIARLWKSVKRRTLHGKIYDIFEDFHGAIDNCLKGPATDHIDDVKSLIARNFQWFDDEIFLAA